MTYNRKDSLIRLIDSILSTTQDKINEIKEIVIYNNNSSDGTLEELNNRYKDNNKIVIYNFEHNTRNRAKRMNFMLSRSTTDWTFLLQDDVFVKTGWFEYWTQFTNNCNDYFLINTDGGYCISLFNKKILELNGYFDEGFCDGEYDDTDYTYRLTKDFADKVKSIKFDHLTFEHDYETSHKSLVALHGILSEKYFLTKYNMSPDKFITGKEGNIQQLHIGFHIIKDDFTYNLKPSENLYNELDTIQDFHYKRIIISTLNGIEFMPQKFIRILDLGGVIEGPERNLSNKVMKDNNIFLYEKRCICIRHVI